MEELHEMTPVAGDRRTAIVLGASIAGLIAARVVASHFERVIIVDRRECIEDVALPQAEHAHVLLKRGLFSLESLFPGLVGELRRSGAIGLDPGEEWWMLLSAHEPYYRFNSGIEVLSFRRALLDRKLQSWLKNRHGNIEWLTGVRVLDVRLAADREPVVLLSGVSQSEPIEIHADLVIDCTGRNSQAPRWLREFGAEGMPRWRTQPLLGYTSLRLRDPELPGGRHALLVTPKANSPRGGVMFPVEDGTYMCTFAGMAGDYPPCECVELSRWLDTPRTETLKVALDSAEVVEDIKAFRKNECEFRRYEKLAHWPRGFLVLGDAVASFNPVWGQGMTSAVLQGEVLLSALARGSLSGRRLLKLQRRIARVIRPIWLLSSAEDRRFLPTQSGWFESLMYRFNDAVFELATTDRLTALRILEVLHLLRSPVALLDPRILLRLLFRAR